MKNQLDTDKDCSTQLIPKIKFIDINLFKPRPFQFVLANKENRK